MPDRLASFALVKALHQLGYTQLIFHLIPKALAGTATNTHSGSCFWYYCASVIAPLTAIELHYWITLFAMCDVN